MIEAAFNTLQLMYFQTIYVLRSEHRSPVIGLLLTIIQSSLMVAVFFALYYVIGVRTSPIRGDFMVFIMTGIFVFTANWPASPRRPNSSPARAAPCGRRCWPMAAGCWTCR